MFLGKNSVLHKGWYFLHTYVLTLARFDLFLQGSLLIVILLETNVLLLLRRQYGAGFTPKTVEDWVMMGSNGAEFLLAPVLSWWGRNKRNYALSLALALASIPGFLVLAVPFVESNHPYVELCGGDVITRSETPTDPSRPLRTTLLVICAVFCALAKVSVWAHGLTYLDDHQPERGPFFYGILISIRLSLGLSAQNWLQNSSLSDTWWHAQLSISCLTLMFTMLFALFRSQMTEFPELEERRDYSTEFFKSLIRIVRNKALVLQTFALAMLHAAVFGFVHYDRAYVQARFHIEAYRQDPQTSRGLSDIFRSLVIIFFVMIFRIRFSSRRPDGVKASTASRVGGVVAGVVSILLVVLTGLNCDVGEIEGVGEVFQQPACSEACGCDSAKYGFSPVCGVNSQSTFFSPCNAGCTEYEDLNGVLLFSNCSCGMERAVRGACSVSRCRLAFSAYQVIFTLMLAVAGSSFLMQGMVILRSVLRMDKPIAMGASSAIIALLAYVLGHMLYVLVSHLTCAYPAGNACALHHSTLWTMCACSAVLALSSAALSLYASKAAYEPTTEL